MGKEKPTSKQCKACKTEIPYEAKVCPQCRKKQGPGGCLIAIIVIIAIASIVSRFGRSDNGSESSGSATKSVEATIEDVTEARESTTEEVTEAPIEYTAYSVDEMMSDLKANALKASEKYKKQYIEITGRLSTIDSSGKYISLLPMEDEWAFTGVQCYIKTDEQKSQVMEMNKDDIITIRGQITEVGEVLGYSLNIDEILMK